MGTLRYAFESGMTSLKKSFHLPFQPNISSNNVQLGQPYNWNFVTSANDQGMHHEMFRLNFTEAHEIVLYLILNITVINLIPTRL